MSRLITSLFALSFLIGCSQLHAAPNVTQVIPLTTGWNLISIQVGTSFTPAQLAGEMPPGYLQQIWGYNPTGNPSTPGQWNAYKKPEPPAPVFSSDLTEIVPGKGYWVQVSQSTSVALTGPAWSGAVSVVSGWNLVGFPGLDLGTSEAQELSAVFGASFNRIQQVWTHNNSSKAFEGYDLSAVPQLKQINGVQPGRSYWVYSTSDQPLLFSGQPFVALPSDSDASPPQPEGLYAGADPKYAGRLVRLPAPDGSDTPYDLNENGILDDITTQDTVLFEKSADSATIIIGNEGGGGILPWHLENSVSWLFTAPADERTWPDGATTRPRGGQGTVSSENDTLTLYADRSGLTPGRKSGESVTLWVGGQAFPINLLLDTASIDGDWRGFATTTRVGGRSVSLGEVRLVLNSFVLGGGFATATPAITTGEVTSIAVTDGGNGYQTPPQVTITGAGSGATAVATISNKRVTAITVTTPGTGYNASTTVTIASPTDKEANGFRAVLNREQSILFPRDVFMDGIFYADNQFKLTTNFEMKAGDRNAPPFNTFPGDAKDLDFNGDGKVDVSNPFPFGIRREVTLIGTRVTPDRLTGSYIESIRGMLPPVTGNTLVSDENQFKNADILTQSQPIFIEGNFVLERQSFTPAQRSIVNTTVTPGITFGGSTSGSRTESVDVDTTANVNGVITVTLGITLGEIDPALLRISLISPNGTPQVLHDYASVLAGSYTLPAGSFSGEPADGSWELLIEWDDTSGERATLNSWGLKIEAVSSHSAFGRLKRSDTGAVIPDVSIRVEGGVTTVSTKTAADGTFTFDNLTENDYTLFINAPGYENYSFTFFVGEEDKDLGDILLVPRTVTLARVEAAPLIGYDELQVELQALVPLSYATAIVTWDFGDGSPLLTGSLSSQVALEDGTLVPVISPTHRYRQPGDFIPQATFSGGGITTTITTGPTIHVQARNTTVLDTSFNFPVNGQVLAFLPQADGSTWIGGSFTTFGGVNRNRILRLGSNGTVDPTFAPYLSGSVLAVATQSDGKLLVGGTFGLARDTGTTSSDTSIPRSRMARFDTNGILDPSFDPAPNSTVQAIAVLPDGKILIAGDFTAVGPTPINRLARLNANGTLDTTFNPNVTGGNISEMILQPDGKILIGGVFSAVGGTTRSRFARILANGSLDTTFTTTASATLNALALDDQGRIYLGGFFGTVGGLPRSRIARLLPTGAVDPAFLASVDEVAGLPLPTVYSILPLPDGKVLVGGVFTRAGGSPRTNLARFHANGSLDTTFDLPANERVICFGLQRDRRVLVGGLFTGLGGLRRSYLARLHPDENQLVRGIGIGAGAARMDVSATSPTAAAFSKTDVLNTFTEGGVTVNMNSATVHQESQWDSATFDLDRFPLITQGRGFASSFEDSDYGRAGEINPGIGQVFIFYNTNASPDGTKLHDVKWDARAYGRQPQVAPLLPQLPALPNATLYPTLYQSPDAYAVYPPANYPVSATRPDRLRMAVTLGGCVLAPGSTPSVSGGVYLFSGRTLK